MASLIVDLDCLKVTGDGEDEVYILLIATMSNGQRWAARLPYDAPHKEHGHWNMNDDDGDSNKHITNIRLTSFSLNKGEWVAFTVLVMEEDGGTSRPWQELAAEILQTIPNPITVVAGKGNYSRHFLIQSVASQVD